MQYHFSQRGYHTLAPDLPGFGKTTSSSAECATWNQSLQLLGQWIRAQAQIKKIWWIGHQAGCLMAAQCAQTFNTMTQRVTLINPPTQAVDLWPSWALSWMPLSMQWNLYDYVTRTRLFPNLIQRQQLAMTLHNVKRLDTFLEKKILFNEKVFDPQRRQEFSHYIKHLPNQIDKRTLADTMALNCPVQIILPPVPKSSFFKQAWLTLRNKPDSAHQHRQQQLIQYIRAGFDVISIASGQLFSPIEKPQEIAEATLLWAQPNLRDVFAADAREKLSKASRILEIPRREGIKIHLLSSIPPEIKPKEGPPPLALRETNAAPAKQ
jgi:pimeloyl-ACP methyl ester carboxylesterase